MRKLWLIVLIAFAFILVLCSQNAAAAGSTWWNSTYNYRYPINCTNVLNGWPISVNGTSGVTLNGVKQFVWVGCQQNLSLYYNSYTQWVIANDTKQVPFDVALGNVSSNLPKQVWGFFASVWHGNSYNDVLNTNNLTMAGLVNLVTNATCPFGVCFEYVNSSSYLYKTNPAGLCTGNNACSITIFLKKGTVNSNALGFGADATYQQQYLNYGTGTLYYGCNGVNYAAIANTPATTTLLLANRPSGNVGTLYINTTAITASDTKTTNVGTTFLAIGAGYFGGYTGSWGTTDLGYISEVRIATSNITLSNFNSTYQNFVNTQGFGSIDPSESGSAPDVTPPTCVLDRRVPANLNDTSSGTFSVYLNCTDTSGINVTKTGDHYWMFVTRTLDEVQPSGIPNRWSIRPPNNNISDYGAGVESYGKIFRAQGRGRSFWYEGLNGSMTGSNLTGWFYYDNHTYAAEDGHYGYLNWTYINGTIIQLNFTMPAVELAAFRQNIPLSYDSLVSETKKNYTISAPGGAGYQLLVMRNDLEAMKNPIGGNYTITAFRDVVATPTAPGSNLRVFYCNSSYSPTGGVSVLASPFCVAINSITSAQLATTVLTDRNSSYSKGSYSVFNGSIGGIRATPLHYYYYDTVEGRPNRGYLYRYANGSTVANITFAQTNRTWISTNLGAAWTQVPITLDLMEFTTKNNNDEFQFGYCVYDLAGNLGCNSTLFTDDISPANHPITAPSIVAYNSTHALNDFNLSGVHNGTMQIRIGCSKDPDNVSAVMHNLTLRDTSGNAIYTINTNFTCPNDAPVWVSFNTVLVPDGYYRMNISAQSMYDLTDIESSMPATVFTINNIQGNAPVVTSPVAGTYGGRINVNWTAATGWGGYSIYRYNVTIQNTSSISLLTVANNSASNLGASFCAKSLPNNVNGWCYQEFANQATSCGGLSTGNYNNDSTLCSSAYAKDGVWDSNYAYECYASSGSYYVNYTKPMGSMNTSLLQEKIGPVCLGDPQILNATIPQTCWNLGNTLIFKFVVSGAGSYRQVLTYCLGSDGVNYQTVYSFSPCFAGSGDQLYEEAMWWNLSNSNYMAFVESVDNSSASITGNSTSFSIAYANHTLSQSPSANMTSSQSSVNIGCNSTFASGITLIGQINITRPGAANYYYNFTAAAGNNTYSLNMPNQGVYNWSCSYTSADCSDGTNSTGVLSILHDSISPTITIDQPTSGQIIDSTSPTNDIVVNYTATDTNRDQCWYQLDSGSYVAAAACANFTLAGLGLGAHTIIVYVNDTVGQTSSAIATFTLGRMSVLLISPADGYVTNLADTGLLNFSCNITTYSGNITQSTFALVYPAGNPFAGYNESVFAQSNSTFQQNISTIPIYEGNYSWSCIANNSANYQISSATRTFLVKRTPPTATIDQPTEYQTFTRGIFNNYSISTPSWKLLFNFTVSNDTVTCLKRFTTDGIARTGVYGCDNQTINFTGSGNGEGAIVFNVTVYDIANNSYTVSRNSAAGGIQYYLYDHYSPGDFIDKINGQFDAEINMILRFGNIGSAGNCTLNAYNNAFAGSVVTCTRTSWFYMFCSPLYDMQKLTNFSMSCSNSSYTFSTPFVALWIDNIAPVFVQSDFKESNQSLFARNLTGTWNITDTNLFRVTASIDGAAVRTVTDINTTFYQFNLSYNTSFPTLQLGQHSLQIQAADSHTAAAIADYDVSAPLFSNAIAYDTHKNNTISIQAVDEQNNLLNPFSSQRQADRYTFAYRPADAAAESYTFQVSAEQPIHLIDRPDSRWQKWIVTGDNWVDFYTNTTPTTVDIQLIDDYTAEVTVTKLAEPSPEPIELQPIGKGGRIITPGESQIAASSISATPELAFSSIGDLNIATLNYTFFTHEMGYYYYTSVTGLQQQSTYVVIVPNIYNYTGLPYVGAGSMVYDGTAYPVVTSNLVNNLTYSVDFATPNVPATTTKVLRWLVNYSGESYDLNLTQTVLHVGYSNCGVGSENTSLTICGIDEETLTNVSNMTLNIDFNLWQGSESVVQDQHYGLSNATCYSFCLNPANTSYQVFSTMEYGDGNLYSDRKYYLYNMTLNTTYPQTVWLYHLNTSLASVITYNIISQQTGQNIPSAYIKILRYYPNLNQYSTVEIEKTDQNGKAVAKMVLYNVFYRELVDYPNGLTRLSTAVSKLSATAKTLAINFGSDLMADFSMVANTHIAAGCNQNTFVCNTTWSSLDGAARTVRFDLYEDTGISRKLIATATSMPTANGQLFLAVPNPKNNTRYEAEAHLIGSDILAASADLLNRINVFTSNHSLQLASLIPLVLLTISIIAALLDLGVVGVVIGSMSGIILGMATTIIPLNVTGIVSIVLLGAILIYKMVK
jgi:hypothetical protein